MSLNKKFAALLLCQTLLLTGCATKTAESKVSSAVSTSIQTQITDITTADSSAVTETTADTILDPAVFYKLDKEITVSFKDKTVIETGEVNGKRYSFTIDLSGWEENTSPDQIAELSRLFWQVYPKLYERFGKLSDAPCEVVLLIENSGYEIAEAWENKIHLHDMWLSENPEDFDCITHELAHVIQHGWDGERLEYESYIERFADYCRFIYCMDNGFYNDRGWTLQTVVDEPDRETSVRFLVWLDYKISGPDRDFMKDYFVICTKGEYASKNWKKAWAELFEGTGFEGKTVSEVWKEYANSDFAALSSKAEQGSVSELLAKYDARKKIKSLYR